MDLRDLPVSITPDGSLVLPRAGVAYFSDTGSPDLGSGACEGLVYDFYKVLDTSRVNNQLEPVEDFKRRPHYVQG